MLLTKNRQRIKALSKRSRRSFLNDFSVLNPTLWANEAIIALLPNMVVGQLISRDFDTTVSRFGDVVNAFIPSKFVMNRKGALCDNVVTQDATGSRVQVPLNQWPQVSFLICDGEEDRNQLDLIDTLLTPAVQALAQGIDRILTAQVNQFLLDNVVGHANLVDSTTIRSYILAAREALNRKNVPVPGRALLLSPGTETQALEVDALTLAMDVGDNGQALREAALGRKYGFDIFMTQTQPEVAAGHKTIGTVTAAAASAGATTVTLAGAGIGTAGASLLVGQWISIAGDDTPQQLTAVNVGASAGVCTIQPGLRSSVSANAVTLLLADGAVNNAAGYIGTTDSPRVIGWAKEILVDGFTDSGAISGAPQIGQFVSFGTDIVNRYTIIGLRVIGGGAFGITLDRPLITALADNAVVHLGPSGKYNFGFLRNAFTMVNRPLPQPRAQTALSRVITDPVNKISIRVTITYDGNKQAHLVTLDTLMGVGILNQDMGVVMLG